MNSLGHSPIPGESFCYRNLEFFLQKYAKYLFFSHALHCFLKIEADKKKVASKFQKIKFSGRSAENRRMAVLKHALIIQKLRA